MKKVRLAKAKAVHLLFGIFIKQKGVILIFSMVMLVLLTLVSVNIIQQNKQGLAIMDNTRQRIQTFSNVEAASLLAEQKINELRYEDENLELNRCIPTTDENDPNQLDEDDVIIEVAETSATATVSGVYCLSGSIESRCTYSNGHRETNVTACDMLYNTGRVSDERRALKNKDGSLYIDPISYNGCPVEVYSIITKIEGDAQTRGQSIIESKYAVNCTGNAS